jgi:hypothetical protein
MGIGWAGKMCERAVTRDWLGLRLCDSATFDPRIPIDRDERRAHILLEDPL